MTVRELTNSSNMIQNNYISTNTLIIKMILATFPDLNTYSLPFSVLLLSALLCSTPSPSSQSLSNTSLLPKIFNISNLPACPPPPDYFPNRLLGKMPHLNLIIFEKL